MQFLTSACAIYNNIRVRRYVELHPFVYLPAVVAVVYVGTSAPNYSCRSDKYYVVLFHLENA